ncbi:MAG: hypothetical protein AB7V16_01435 [Vulcanibacillus sp.]
MSPLSAIFTVEICGISASISVYSLLYLATGNV